MSDRPETIGSSERTKHSVAATGTESASRTAALIFLSIVAALLVLPLVQTVAPVFRDMVRPLEERRRPASFPAPARLLRANGDFASGLNTWFDDRVGFRDLFIRTKNQIDYSLFHSSRKVYVGKDGWLFDRGQLDAVGMLDSAQMAALEGSFVALGRLLSDRGIRLVVVGYPDKSRIYPEMAPPDMRLIPAGGNDDKLRAFLGRQPTLTFIDAQAIFEHEKTLTRERLYAKTDMHATEAGQLPVVKEIIARIAAAEGRPEIRWNEDFKLGHMRWGPGSEGRFLAPLVPVEEDGFPYFVGHYAVGAAESDGTWNPIDLNDLNHADAGVGRPFDFEFRSRPELCPQRLPGLVLFGNSFSDLYWSLGLHRYFCFARRARNPISRFKLFYDTIPPDTKYFIFEYISPWLPHDAPPMDQIEKSG